MPGQASWERSSLLSRPVARSISQRWQRPAPFQVRGGFPASRSPRSPAIVTRFPAVPTWRTATPRRHCPRCTTPAPALCPRRADRTSPAALAPSAGTAGRKPAPRARPSSLTRRVVAPPPDRRQTLQHVLRECCPGYESGLHTDRVPGSCSPLRTSVHTGTRSRWHLTNALGNAVPHGLRPKGRHASPRRKARPIRRGTSRSRHPRSASLPATCWSATSVTAASTSSTW